MNKVLPEYTTSKKHHKENLKEHRNDQANTIENHEDNIRFTDKVIINFLNTFTQMKAEIYKLRA